MCYLTQTQYLFWSLEKGLNVQLQYLHSLYSYNKWLFTQTEIKHIIMDKSFQFRLISQISTKTTITPHIVFTFFWQGIKHKNQQIKKGNFQRLKQTLMYFTLIFLIRPLRPRLNSICYKRNILFVVQPLRSEPPTKFWN